MIRRPAAEGHLVSDIRERLEHWAWARRGCLAPIYDRFADGFNTADLKEANALLEELK